MHWLQGKFATAEGEQEWCDRLHQLVEQGHFDQAEAMLAEALDGLESEIAGLCRAMPRDAVVLEGWEDLVDAIEVQEGAPITGVTLAIANDADVAFEKGTYHTPDVLLSLYTDEEWNWSAADQEKLLDECAKEEPGWTGAEEDVEVYLEVSGLERLNTALLFHKQRFFFRDGEMEHAPLRYVDFVVGNWWRALRFHQAVASELAAAPLPACVNLLTGLVDMRADAVCLHCGPARSAAAPAQSMTMAESAPMPLAGASEEALAPVEEAGSMGSLSAIRVSREAPVEEVESVGAQLRRRVAEESTSNDEDEPKRGLFARMFARG
jgi:hypothetical protein